MKKTFLAFLATLTLVASMSAQTLTFTAGAAEVALSNVKNQLYHVSELYFQYNSNTEVFSAFTVEGRDLVYKANVSTVTISGLSTAASKIAYLENTHLKCNTAQFNFLVPKDGIAVRYNVSGKATQIFGKYSMGKVPLWSGHADSIKTSSADTNTADRLANLRKIVRGSTPFLVGTDLKAPTIAVGAASGGGATASISGNGLSGEIDIDTGTSTTTTGVLATITLPVACPNKCFVKLQPSSTFGSTQDAKVFVTTTGSTFVLNANGTALTASTADAKWFYFVTCN